MQVYLAFYKGTSSVKGFKGALYRSMDWLIRKFTKGAYSHVEIAIPTNAGFACYSSSIMDGGVRCTAINVHSGNWDLVPIDCDVATIKAYFEQTKHQKYDFKGAIASTIPFYQSKSKQFCSEWCFNAIKGNNKDGWRFSPNDLHVMFNEGLV